MCAVAVVVRGRVRVIEKDTSFEELDSFLEDIRGEFTRLGGRLDKVFPNKYITHPVGEDMVSELDAELLNKAIWIPHLFFNYTDILVYPPSLFEVGYISTPRALEEIAKVRSLPDRSPDFVLNLSSRQICRDTVYVISERDARETARRLKEVSDYQCDFTLGYTLEELQMLEVHQMLVINAIATKIRYDRCYDLVAVYNDLGVTAGESFGWEKNMLYKRKLAELEQWSKDLISSQELHIRGREQQRVAKMLQKRGLNQEPLMIEPRNRRKSYPGAY